jgi:hypothetical protein
MIHGLHEHFRYSKIGLDPGRWNLCQARDGQQSGFDQWNRAAVTPIVTPKTIPWRFLSHPLPDQTRRCQYRNGLAGNAGDDNE